MTPASWLIDKSVLARIHLEAVADAVLPRIRAGEVGVSLVTELEVGFSARSHDDYRSTREDVIDHLIPVTMPVRAEQRARELQFELVRLGQHRAVSIPDLLLAAIADIDGLTVLHYDSDFDLIAGVTGQTTEWVVQRGSID
ncbi:MAG: PIN domain nuclease [Actinobacteria bacterium]|nr:PIN domain nuclease [Actinomycetota bacterium]